MINTLINIYIYIYIYIYIEYIVVHLINNCNKIIIIIITIALNYTYINEFFFWLTEKKFDVYSDK